MIEQSLNSFTLSVLLKRKKNMKINENSENIHTLAVEFFF